MLTSLYARLQSNVIEPFNKILTAKFEDNTKSPLNNFSANNAALHAVAQQISVSDVAATRDDKSQAWLNGGYKNEPVKVETKAQSTQSAVMKAAYEGFARQAGLSEKGVQDFVTERMAKNGGRVFRTDVENTVYQDTEFAEQASKGGMLMYASNEDVAQLKSLKTREQALLEPIGATMLEPGITPEQAAATWEAAQPILAEAGKTIVGASAAYIEDQFGMSKETFEYWGLTPPDESNQNAAGRAAGHTASAVQAAAEVAVGSIEVGGGTLLDLTGVGSVIGVPAQVVGVATITHGVVMGTNTIHNILHDPILNKDTEAASNEAKSTNSDDTGTKETNAVNETAPIIETANAKSTAPLPKFKDYIFKPGATHGKNKVFESLGYNRNDSEQLLQVYEKQAAEKFARGEYKLGDKDVYGQRIDIEIELNGVRDASGKTSYIKSGWMIKPDGSISLNTPFTGFTK